jgi:hypothetical protein
MQQESLVLDRPTGPEIHDAGIIADQRVRAARRRSKECPVCLGQHEERIHGATLNVLQWFRGQVTKNFDIVFYE